MHRVFAYSIEIWPGSVRIHTDYEEDGWQVVELSAEQVPEFCRLLTEQAKAAADLGVEMEGYELETRIQKALSRKTKEVVNGSHTFD